MPRKACCCKANNCCDDIFYTNFIILAGETLDDAAPVDPNDVIVLTMNRPGAGSGPASTIFPDCPSQDCTCFNCSWIRANFCAPKGTNDGICGCDDPDQNCEDVWYQQYGECGPYPGPTNP